MNRTRNLVTARSQISIILLFFAGVIIFIEQLPLIVRLNVNAIALTKTWVRDCAQSCVKQLPLSPYLLAASDGWMSFDLSAMKISIQNQCGQIIVDSDPYHRLQMMRGLQWIIAGQPITGQSFLINQLNDVGDPWSQLIVGNLLMMRKQNIGAIEKWQCAVPLVETYLVSVADLLFEQGDYQSYQKVLQIALQYAVRRSTRVTIYRKLGSLMLYQIRDVKTAISLLSEAVNIDRSEYLARVSLTHAFVQVKEYDQALIHGYIALSRPQASKDRPVERARVLRMIASSYLGLGNYSDALSALKESLELDPNNRWGHLTLAQVYEKLGNLELAQRERAIVEVLPLNSDQ